MKFPFLIGAIGLSGVFLAGLSPWYNTGDRAPHSHHAHHEAANPKAASSRHDDTLATVHSTHNHAGHDHLALLSVPATASSPTLDFELIKDQVSGWNLHILTTNFRFSPEKVNAANEFGQGHAHVYVNGTKLARIYGPWFHIGALPSGEISFTVTLNANDHRTLAVDKTALSVTKTLQID